MLGDPASDGLWRRRLDRRGLSLGMPGRQRVEQVGNEDVLFGVVAKRKAWVYPIQVSPPDLTAFDIPCRFQVRDYIVSGPLGYPDVVSDFPSRMTRVVGEIAEDQTVVGDQGPLSSLR